MRTRTMRRFIASDCTRDGKLYVSAAFDCFGSSVIGLAMDTNMKAPLCVKTLEYTAKAYPGIREAIIHSGRCHDNTRCESMWARMKSEVFYGRYDTEKMTMDELRMIIWRYFISHWNNRRICSTGGLPPMIKDRKNLYIYKDFPGILAYDIVERFSVW